MELSEEERKKRIHQYQDLVDHIFGTAEENRSTPAEQMSFVSAVCTECLKFVYQEIGKKEKIDFMKVLIQRITRDET